jgi:hypothetical protein
VTPNYALGGQNHRTARWVQGGEHQRVYVNPFNDFCNDDGLSRRLPHWCVRERAAPTGTERFGRIGQALNLQPESTPTVCPRIKSSQPATGDGRVGQPL